MKSKLYLMGEANFNYNKNFFYIARGIPEENWSKKSVKTQYQAE